MRGSGGGLSSGGVQRLLAEIVAATATFFLPDWLMSIEDLKISFIFHNLNHNVRFLSDNLE